MAPWTASLVRLGPAFAGYPSERSTGTEIDQIACVLLGEGSGPRVEPGVGDICAVSMRMLNRPAQVLAAPPFQLVPNRVQHKPAPIPFAAVDFLNDLSRQGHGDAFSPRHILLRI